MKRDRVVVTFFISIAIIAILIGTAIRATHAQNANPSDTTVLAKLDEVLNNQKFIMQEIAGLKEDLRIIKIRITQSQ